MQSAGDAVVPGFGDSVGRKELRLARRRQAILKVERDLDIADFVEFSQSLKVGSASPHFCLGMRSH